MPKTAFAPHPRTGRGKKKKAVRWPKILGPCSVACDATSGAWGTAWVPTEAGYKILGGGTELAQFFCEMPRQKNPQILWWLPFGLPAESVVPLGKAPLASLTRFAVSSHSCTLGFCN